MASVALLVLLMREWVRAARVAMVVAGFTVEVQQFELRVASLEWGE